METFSQQAWRQNRTRYEAILDMPFNRELSEGTLSPERFRYYMIQDAHYLEGFARALSLASAKGHNVDDVVLFAGAAQEAILVERSLHADYFAQFGVTPDIFDAAEPSPVCEHYVSYLLRVAALEPFEVALAALLPCFWIYREVGKHIHAHAAKSHPYQAWIDTYAGADFEKAVDDVIAVVDAAAKGASPRTIKAMHHAFTRATQLEWMFWDGAYQLQQWSV
ncbi:MAG: thiaminase II [Alphaproteobacteria bacterium]|nr:MAG: thiaminase II [Alphaproteobacteria bacterium]